jgi:hypothetical protein
VGPNLEKVEFLTTSIILQNLGFYRRWSLR